MAQGKRRAAGDIVEETEEVIGAGGIEGPDVGCDFLEPVGGMGQEGSVALLFQESGQVAGEAAGIGEDQPEAGFGFEGMMGAKKV